MRVKAGNQLSQSVNVLDFGSGTSLVDGDGDVQVSFGGSIPALSLSQVPYPWYIAHRGAGPNIGPDESLSALRMMLNRGWQTVDGGDMWLLKDGGLAVMHDSTVDRTTTSSGNVTDFLSGPFSQLVLDCSSWFAASWKDTTPPLFDDWLRTVAGRAIIFPEAKNTGSGAAIVAALQRWGFTKNAVVNSFLDAELAAARTAGIATALNTTGSDPSVTPSTLKAAGTDHILVDTTVSDSFLASCIAAGLAVHVYVVNRQVDAAAWLTKGVSAIWSDDPVYVSGKLPVITSDPYTSQTFWDGQECTNGSDRGSWPSAGHWGFGDTVGGFLQTWVRQGWAYGFMGAHPRAFTVAGTVTFDAMSTGTASANGPQLFIGDETYVPTSKGSGYLVLFREDGTLRTYTVANGVTTNVDSRSLGTSVVQGNTVAFSVQVTGTQVIVKATLTGQTQKSFTLTDSSHSGAYLSFGKIDNNTNGHYSFSSVSLSTP